MGGRKQFFAVSEKRLFLFESTKQLLLCGQFEGEGLSDESHWLLLMRSASDWLVKKALATAAHETACLESGECKRRRDSQIRQPLQPHTHARKTECASREIMRDEGGKKMKTNDLNLKQD